MTLCSMCEDAEATTTWGFPVCQFCADWLTRLDADLRSEFGAYDVPVERYIDRARRAIRQRHADATVLSSDDPAPPAAPPPQATP